MSREVVIMLGSNAGDRNANIDKALQALTGLMTISRISRRLDSPDINGIYADYLNLVAVGHTQLDLDDLNEQLKNLEQRLGRDRSMPGVVTIDIDTVIYDGHIVKPKEYTALPFRTLYLLTD